MGATTLRRFVPAAPDDMLEAVLAHPAWQRDEAGWLRVRPAPARLLLRREAAAGGVWLTAELWWQGPSALPWLRRCLRDLVHRQQTGRPATGYPHLEPGLPAMGNSLADRVAGGAGLGALWRRSRLLPWPHTVSDVGSVFYVSYLLTMEEAAGLLPPPLVPVALPGCPGHTLLTHLTYRHGGLRPRWWPRGLAGLCPRWLQSNWRLYAQLDPGRLLRAPRASGPRSHERVEAQERSLVRSGLGARPLRGVVFLGVGAGHALLALLLRRVVGDLPAHRYHRSRLAFGSGTSAGGVSLTLDPGRGWAPDADIQGRYRPDWAPATGWPLGLPDGARRDQLLPWSCRWDGAWWVDPRRGRVSFQQIRLGFPDLAAVRPVEVVHHAPSRALRRWLGRDPEPAHAFVVPQVRLELLRELVLEAGDPE